MAKIRTIEKAFNEIKQLDPNTCITRHFIKSLIVGGKIPYRKSGNRYLIDVDEVLSYMKGGNTM